MSQTTIILLLVTLNAALLRAFRDDIAFWPTLPTPWRQFAVAVFSMIVGPALDLVARGEGWGPAFLTGLAGCIPVLVNLLVAAFRRVPASGTLVCLAFLLGSGSGCAALRPACKVVHVADQACTVFVMADGSELSLGREDGANLESLGKALGRRGVVGCK